MDTKSLMDSVLSYVKEASAIMEDSHFDVHEKDGYANICTSADTSIQQLLHRRLSALLPGCGFICEEDDVYDPDHEYVWIVDPIDGTANFARGIPDCAISVALWSRTGGLLIGVVYSPFRRMLFRAEKGCGAFLNDRPIHTSDRPFADSILCTALSLYHKEYAGICNGIIMEAFPLCNDIRRFGSCAMELCYIACGLCDLFFEYRIMPWDHAAASLILQEAGGVITGRDASPLQFVGPTILVGANKPDNHAVLNDIVTRHT